MTDEEFREHVCGRKRRYTSRRYAKQAAKRHYRHADRVRPYACAFCGQWHLGHPKVMP